MIMGNLRPTRKKIFVRLFEVDVVFEIPLWLCVTGEVEVLFYNADGVVQLLLGNPPVVVRF